MTNLNLLYHRIEWLAILEARLLLSGSVKSRDGTVGSLCNISLVPDSRVSFKPRRSCADEAHLV